MFVLKNKKTTKAKEDIKDANHAGIIYEHKH